MTEFGSIGGVVILKMSLPKIPFWGVMRTNWRPNHPNGGVRRKYFHLRSRPGVLGGIDSV
jgi:hypothetical protein